MRYLIAIISILIILPIIGLAQVKLPKLISDGMILQRNTDLKIWGWSSPNESISVVFIDDSYETKANDLGEWELVIKKHEAGGPYKMTIQGKNKITINNILLGDVFLCSGQSNMQLNMKRVGVIYKEEIATCENPNIRQFQVPVKWNYSELQNDLQSGEWKEANQQNIYDFSAVSYFFARKIHETHQIPVGIMLCAAGGSSIEGWMSSKTLVDFPEQLQIAKQLKDSTYLKNLIDSEKKGQNTWFNNLSLNDLGRKDIPWMYPQFNDSNWKSTTIPSIFNEFEPAFKNGIIYFRKDLTISKSFEGKAAKLNLGRIVDSDSVFLNGHFVGNTTYQYPPRRYNVPEGIIKEGKNNITIKVISQSEIGAIIKDKSYQLTIEDKSFDLKGEWKYKIAANATTCPSSTYFPGMPLGLFNAMFFPIINYSYKSILWYQGESNTNRPNDYFRGVTSLTAEWRKLLNNPSLPFLFVQLPNYGDTQSEPTNSAWAQLRNEQLKSLTIPNTEMATTIDLGEWNDLHPLRKKEVGERLALAAEYKIYNNNSIVYSGPIYKSMKIIADKIELTFNHCGSGLKAKENMDLKYFAIAGEDNNYIWAKAVIKGDKVIVWSNKVKNPVSVRYAWADNPDGANLYNGEGLPASPFTTKE